MISISKSYYITIFFKFIMALMVSLTMLTVSFADSNNKKINEVNLYIPPVGVGLLMVDAAKNPKLKKYANKINVIRWNTPDQLRSGIIDGSINITFVPSYVGANFYNKGIKFKLMNIITGGLLYIISTDKSINKIEDLKGKTILIPFQNDMPDLVLQAMIKKLKLTGIKIKYVATPNVAVKMALSGKADTLLLPEIAVTKVQLMAKKNSGVIFNRAIDMTSEYGRIFNTKAYIPQAGIAVRKSFADKNPEFIKVLHKAIQESAKELLKNKERVIKMTNTVWKDQGKIFAKSIKWWNIDVQSASNVKDEIEFFYNIMYDLNPKIIGSKLPEDAFYMD